MSMNSFRTGFFNVRQKRARGGRGLALATAFRALAFLLTAGSMTPAAARAVAHPVLIALSPPPPIADDAAGGLMDGRVARSAVESTGDGQGLGRRAPVSHAAGFDDEEEDSG